MSRTGRWYAYAVVGYLAAVLSGHVWLSVIIFAITTPALIRLLPRDSHDDSTQPEQAADLAALQSAPPPIVREPESRTVWVAERPSARQTIH